jgi:hypothetical protein
MNTTGIAAALAIFLGVWLGHVAVRKIEFVSRTIWLPAVLAALAGLALLISSFFATLNSISAVLGIVGVTLLWDAFEFTRQERRIRKGHAPANPQNPRHARILSECPEATTLDLLAREPVGRRVGLEEAPQLVMASSSATSSNEAGQQPGHPKETG